jgi:O-6-methylguanine DNA methyltransferase
MKNKPTRDPHLQSWLGDMQDEPLAEKLTAALDEVYTPGPDERSTKKALKNLELRLEEALPPKAYFDQIPNTPVGNIWVAVDDKGLVAIDYDIDEAEFIQYLENRINVRPVRSGVEVAGATGQIFDYLTGKTSRINLPVDLRTATNFQRKVLEATSRVPRGQVATYAEIAKQIGKPSAFRAVGQALRRNPIPIVIPCHRVIASDGTLGGYGGILGDKRKIKLLKLEGVMLA